MVNDYSTYLSRSDGLFQALVNSKLSSLGMRLGLGGLLRICYKMSSSMLQLFLLIMILLLFVKHNIYHLMYDDGCKTLRGKLFTFRPLNMCESSIKMLIIMTTFKEVHFKILV